MRQDLSRLGCGTQSGLWESGGGMQQKPMCRWLIFFFSLIFSLVFFLVGRRERGNEVTSRPCQGQQNNSARDGWIPLTANRRARLRLALQGKWTKQREGRGGGSLVARAVFVAAAGMSVYGVWAVGTVRHSPPGGASAPLPVPWPLIPSSSGRCK